MITRVLIALGAVLALIGAAYWHGVTTTTEHWEARTQKAMAEAQASVRQAEQAAAKRVNEIEGELHVQQSTARAQIERLRGELAAGTVRLRERLTCPAVPGGDTDPGIRDGAQARGLRREDAEFLLSEAARADEVTRQLAACQLILNNR